jgi:hypothetical protein
MSELVGGGGGERRQAEQEAELDGRRERQADGDGSEDRHQAAAGARPEGGNLCDPDEQPVAHGRRLDGAGATDPPSGEQEDDDAADCPCDRDRSDAEQVLLDLVAEDRAHGGGRHEGDGERHEQLTGGLPAGRMPGRVDEGQDAAPVEHEHGGDGAELHHHEVRVDGVAVQVEQAGDHREMTGRADRQELGEAFDEAEDDALEERQLGGEGEDHGRSSCRADPVMASRPGCSGFRQVVYGLGRNRPGRPGPPRSRTRAPIRPKELEWTAATPRGSWSRWPWCSS